MNNVEDDFEDIEDNILPGFADDEDEKIEEENIISNNIDNDFSYNTNIIDNVEENINNTYIKSYDNDFNDEEFETLLASEKKVVAFVGAGKNGTSFLINNIALLLSNMGINTAILDATSNKNAYYIFTKNNLNLREIAFNSLENLSNEIAEGIKVNNNLTVYTTTPRNGEQINNSRPILETLIRNHSLVLIDCDFSTPIEYFNKSQEIYLVQSMDILTIQPLTEFLRELKDKNVLDERKIRIIFNKVLKIKGANEEKIIGGMAKYKDAECSIITNLFNSDTVKVAARIPFDEDVYIKYLGYMVECEIKINSYPKEFKLKLNNLAETVYPLLPGTENNKKNKKKHVNLFSDGMNNTLDNMRKKY